MVICDKHGITEEFRYDKSKEESMTGTIMQIITSNFYIIRSSSDPYNQQQNKS